MTAAHITINGQTVTRGAITIPMFGAWSADLTLSLPDVITPAVTVQIGALSIVGTVIRQTIEAGARSARIVGGAAGWRKTLRARGYSHVAGVKLSSVLSDAARETGETIEVSSDRTIGTSYARRRGQGHRVLERLLNGEWWVDLDGTTRTRARTISPVRSAFTIESWSGARGEFSVATEAYEDWLPGRTFSNSTMTSVQSISSTSIVAENGGKVRLAVLTGTAEERLLASVRAIVRQELAALDYVGVWEYTITAATPSTIDATPTDARMPSLANVPMMPGLLGESVTLTPGKICRIIFVNGDPSRAECVGAEGNAALMAIDASTFIRIGAGALPVIVAGNLAGIFPCIPTQLKVLA